MPLQWRTTTRSVPIYTRNVQRNLQKRSYIGLTRTARHFLTVVHSHIVLHKRRFWGACILAGIRPFSLGVMKGILIRNIENWLSKIYSIQAEFYLSDTIIQIFLWQSIIMHTAHLIGDLKHIYSLCCLMTMNFGLAILKKCLNLTNLNL